MALEAGARLRKPGKFIAYSTRLGLSRAPMFSPITPFIGLVASLSAWIGPAIGSAGQPDRIVQRMVVREEVVLYVPIRRRPPPILEWIERKGPKCLSASKIVGASMAGPSAVDFVLTDQSRVRAELDRGCRGLDFYGSFYVEPQEGAVCAGSEEIRSRVGGGCRIDRFRRLVRKVKR